MAKGRLMGLCAIGLLALTACVHPKDYKGCGTFNTAKLRTNLRSDYFERGGVESAKAALGILLEQYECEKGMP